MPRCVVFEDNELYDHLKYWYLEVLSYGRLTMQIRPILRSTEVKRSPIYDFIEILLYCF